MSSPHSEQSSEWKKVESKRNSKRKNSSPVEKETKSIRRRYLSSSLPDLSEMNSMNDNENENLNSSSNPQGDLQPPLIKSNEQTYSLPELIANAFKKQTFMNQLVPIIAESLKPVIAEAVQSAFAILHKTIQDQTKTIDTQSKQIDKLSKQLNECHDVNQDLQQQIWRLQDTVDDLEQYGRRNSLRFHNCHVPQGKSTDEVIMSICKERLGIALQDDDRSRSHPIGKANRKGNNQIICKFKNWKIKNKIYTAKRSFRNTDIFVTEDLTQYKQSIIQELVRAKRAGKIYSFWTNDGRIFLKLSDKGRKHIICSVNELHELAPPDSNSQC